VTAKAGHHTFRPVTVIYGRPPRQEFDNPASRAETAPGSGLLVRLMLLGVREFANWVPNIPTRFSERLIRLRCTDGKQLSIPGP
jgi:hypothetical protein